MNFLTINKKYFFCTFLFIFLLITSFSSFAQKDNHVKISKRITWVDGKQYYLHTVKKGEDINNISKAYKVQPKDIIIENPSAMNGVKQDQVLKIPMVEDKENFIYHTVEKGQTLYSISKKYETSINDLVKLNPTVENGLKTDMILKIAKKKAESSEAIKSEGKEKDSQVVKDKEKEKEKNLNKKENSEKTENSDQQKEETSNTDSDEYLYHTVEKGQGIYAILKKYKITEDDLYEANPILKERGLQKDEKIKIPKKSNQKKKKEEITAEKEKQSAISGEKQKEKESATGGEKQKEKEKENTQKKDSLNEKNNENQSRKENTLKKDSIPDENKNKKDITQNSTKDTTKTVSEKKEEKQEIGETIKKAFARGEEKKPCAYFDYNASKIVFKIALLAPFYINQNSGYTVKAGRKKDEEPPVYPKSIKFIEFYQGFLVALDSLKQLGFNAEILTYDTNKDSARLVSLSNKKELENLDLIIGPFFSSSLKQFSAFSAQSQIPLVSPLSQNNDFLKENPYAFQINPSNIEQISSAADYLTNTKNKNFIVVNTGKEDEIELINHFKNKVYELTDKKFSSDPGHFKEIIYKETGFNGIKNALSNDLDNIIFIPSVRESLLAGILNKLNAISDKSNIYILGFSSWCTEDNIEQDYLFNLQYTYYTSMYINYASDSVKKFIEKYRNFYSTEPTRYSFQGYDIGLYFGNALMKYGKQFPACIESDTLINKNGLQTGFYFQRLNDNDGFENKKTFIIQFDKEYNISNVTPGKQ